MVTRIIFSLTKNFKDMKVKVIEEAGQLSVQAGIHLPVGGFSEGWQCHTEKTLITMIGRGEEHAKAERLLIAYLQIKAPRYIWAELDTYTVGVTSGSSSSTMYTLLRSMDKAKSSVELEWLFDDTTKPIVVRNFFDYYKEHLSDLRDKGLKLELTKSALPEGFMQTRVKMFSYQTLRRMYKQRHNHRLSWWQDFFKELKPQLKHQELIELWVKK